MYNPLINYETCGLISDYDQENHLYHPCDPPDHENNLFQHSGYCCMIMNIMNMNIFRIIFLNINRNCITIIVSRPVRCSGLGTALPRRDISDICAISSIMNDYE